MDKFNKIFIQSNTRVLLSLYGGVNYAPTGSGVPNPSGINKATEPKTYMECDYIKRKIKASTKCALLLIATLLIMSPAAVSAQSVGAYNVKVTSKYVMATGKCSCSLFTNYRYHTRVFYNYDPSSHTWGTLDFEEGPSSWTSPEGMWYSVVTDVDYCLVHGKSHDHRGFYLRPYNGVINGKIVKDGYFTGKKAVSHNTTQNVTQNTNSDIPKVQAQNYEEESIELIIGDKRYIIDKKKLEELKSTDFGVIWINGL